VSFPGLKYQANVSRPWWLVGDYVGCTGGMRLLAGGSGQGGSGGGESRGGRHCRATNRMSFLAVQQPQEVGSSSPEIRADDST